MLPVRLDCAAPAKTAADQRFPWLTGFAEDEANAE
jgi:hypothetical protein